MNYTEPIVTELKNSSFSRAGVRVRVLHEYQNHPFVSGNKWWKLKYNLGQARREGHRTLLTFGGAFSNHIYATAGAAKEEGFESIGIIRGEEVDNPTLAFARSMGMKLAFVSREEYRRKEEEDFVAQLRSQYGDFYLIPEGGTNEYAIEGCVEWGKKLLNLDFDRLYLPVGTGGTMAGLLKGIGNEREVIGVPVLKNYDFGDGSWKLLKDYHHGGYAKMPMELVAFCEHVKEEYQIIVEPVYTGKLFWAVFDQIEKGLIPRGTTILIVHTGGLQASMSGIPPTS